MRLGAAEAMAVFSGSAMSGAMLRRVYQGRSMTQSAGKSGRGVGLRVVANRGGQDSKALFADSLDQLKLLTNSLPVLIAYVDRELRFRFSNRAHQEYWGRSEAEILGAGMPDLLGEEMFRQAEPFVRRALRGESAAFETMNEYPGRGPRYVSVSYLPDKDDQGQVRGVFVLAQDITDRRLVEERLRHQQEETSVLFHTMPAFIWYKDTENRILRVNRRAAEATGLSVEQVEGASTYELYPEFASKYHEDDLEVVRSGQPKFGIIEPIHLPSGEQLWLRTDKIPYRNPDGSIRGVVVFSVDITKRKNAEDALATSELRLRRILEGMQIIPWEAEAGSGTFTYIGPQVEAILGYPSDRWYSRDFHTQCMHPDDCQRVLELSRKFAEAEDEYELIYRMRNVHGQYRWFRDFVSVDRVKNGPVMLRGFLLDITAEKDAESTRVSLEEQLHTSQKMEALGTLAGGIAHDFNNILGGILGYTELALGDVAEQSAASEYLARVQRSALRAKDLVHQILTFSQRRKMQLGVVDVGRTIEEVLSLARATIPSTIAIRTAFPPEPLCITANETQLHQVVLNIVSNAAYAMRESGGVLEVRLSRCSGEELNEVEAEDLAVAGYARISIRDTGPGMSESVRSRIFEPYFTTKPVGEGTGLGLSVVHGIVASLRGAIECRSKAGSGTTFVIFLPLTGAAAAKESLPLPDQHRRSGKILFVDDEEMLASLGKLMLGKLGYEVVSCTNGTEALATFCADPASFDLVVTDQTMPDIAGEALLDRIREVRPGIPAILSSGYGGSTSHETGGANDIEFLMKPFTMDELGARVARLLDRKARSR